LRFRREITHILRVLYLKGDLLKQTEANRGRGHTKWTLEREKCESVRGAGCSDGHVVLAFSNLSAESNVRASRQEPVWRTSPQKSSRSIGCTSAYCVDAGTYSQSGKRIRCCPPLTANVGVVSSDEYYLRANCAAVGNNTKPLAHRVRMRLTIQTAVFCDGEGDRIVGGRRSAI